MGKYDPWDSFFASLEGDRVRFDLDDFEELAGVQLPPSAREHVPWWWQGHYYAKWSDHGWHARPQLGANEVVFERTARRDTDQAEASQRAEQPRTTESDLLLLGCVATKGPVAAPAKDLYVSALWRKRRAYGEAAGKPWLILSAEYGLVDPDDVIEPYDRYLEREPRAYRDQWSRVVADGVIARARAFGAQKIEIHAGAAYIEHGLERELRRAGLDVIRPLQGLRQGEQLAWYGGSVRVSQPRQPAAARPAPPSGPVRVSADHVSRIAELYRSGDLGESWDQLPEAWEMPTTNPTSQRLWLTFVAAVDRARDAAHLWSAAQRTWRASPWVFDPAEVANRSISELGEALRMHGVSQRHSTDAFAWKVIGESLADSDCPSPVRDAIDGRPVEAPTLLMAVRTEMSGGTPMFPLLRGPKIANMWVRMLVFPGGASVEGIESIPVAVDTHVQRITEMLGLVPASDLSESHREEIERVWFKGVELSGTFGAPPSIDGTAAGIDPALWAVGKEGCSKCESARRKVRIGSICDICVLGRIDG